VACTSSRSQQAFAACRWRRRSAESFWIPEGARNSRALADMNTIADIEFSRPLAAVQELGEAAREDGSFVDKTVLLTGEAAVLRTANGRWMAEDCLRLMVRTWRKLTVYLPSGLETLKDRLKSLAAEI